MFSETQEVVVYRSHGRCLVMGGNDALLGLLKTVQQWPGGVSVRMLVLDEPSREFTTLSAAKDVTWTKGTPTGLREHLGSFRVTLEEGGCLPETYDLIIDCMDSPLLQREVLPYGYFISRKDPATVVAQLPAWIGEFEKPRFFDYDQSLCIHGGNRGCNHCIDACPAEAAYSVSERKIAIDPYLCQGCGDCVASCPTGALSYRSLDRAAILATISERLSGKTTLSGIVFHVEDRVLPQRYSDSDWLNVPLPSVAACGPEIWLALLAAGIPVVALQGEGLPPTTRENLQRHIAWVRALLEGLGFEGGRITWLEDLEEEIPPPASYEKRSFAPLADKRDLLRLALNRLERQAPLRPREIPLPEGAPLGAVEVDDRRCTLCFACVAACPLQALQTQEGCFQLAIVEQNCVQCGWCKDVCPEDAITLVPRFKTDPQRRRQPETLHQESAFHCLECGKPFGNRQLIAKIMERIAAHPMFTAAEQRRRLLLCEDCRVRDMVRHGA